MQEHFRVGCCSQIYTLVLALDHMFSKTDWMSHLHDKIDTDEQGIKRILRPMVFFVFIPSSPPPPLAPRLVMLRHRI